MTDLWGLSSEESVFLSSVMQDVMNERPWEFDKLWADQKKRMTKEERLWRLGISEEAARRFIDEFGPVHSIVSTLKYDTKYGTVDPGDWRRLKNGDEREVRTVSMNWVLDHLLHRRRIISTAKYEDHWGEFLAAQILFDLDVHTPEQERTLRTRYDTLRLHFRSPPLVYRSSNSMGLHVIGGLPDTKVADIQAMGSQIAFASGLRIPEDMEVFPKLGCTIRMPLGPGSKPLDPETLKPIAGSLEEYMEHTYTLLQEHRKQSDLLLLNDEGPLDASSDIVVIRSTPAAFVEERRHADWSDAERLHRDGLSGPGTRVEAILKLTRYFTMKCGIREVDDLVNLLTDFIDRKHNGYSSRYLDAPEAVIADIVGIATKAIDYVCTNGYPSGGARIHRSRLGPSDYARILEVTIAVNRGIHAHNPGKLFEGIADCFAYVKKKSGGQDGLEIYIPKETMVRSFTGWSKNTSSSTHYRKMLDELERIGVLLPVDLRYWAGRCRTYRLIHEFEADGNIDDHREGLNVALRRAPNETVVEYCTRGG